MAQGRFTRIISMIKWIRTSRLSINNSPSLSATEGALSRAVGLTHALPSLTHSLTPLTLTHSLPSHSLTPLTHSLSLSLARSLRSGRGAVAGRRGVPLLLPPGPRRDAGASPPPPSILALAPPRSFLPDLPRSRCQHSWPERERERER